MQCLELIERRRKEKAGHVSVVNVAYSSHSLSLQKDVLKPKKIQRLSRSMIKALWTACVVNNIKVYQDSLSWKRCESGM